MVDSADITNVRKISAVRLRRLETALSNAVQAENQAMRELQHAECSRDDATSTLNSAKADAANEPANEGARFWQAICAERLTDAAEAVRVAQGRLADTQADRESCAAAIIRHKSRDDALAEHGRVLASQERRFAEIKREGDDVSTRPQGAHFFSGGFR
jgi:hypothetical protein